MRAIFIASFVTNMILDLASLAILPDRVAIHFGMGGTPNGWATNLSDPVRLDERLLLIALAIFLGYIVFWIVALVRAFRIPPDS